MSYTTITERMRALKLQGMAMALENVLTSKQASHLNGEQLLELLLQQEYDDRKSRKIDRLRMQAKFRYNASLDQVTPSANRNLDANQLAALSTCSWIEKAENLLITGPTGAGKSHLASAFGNQACEGFRGVGQQWIISAVNEIRINCGDTHIAVVAAVNQDTMLVALLIEL